MTDGCPFLQIRRVYSVVDKIRYYDTLTITYKSFAFERREMIAKTVID